MKIIKEKYNENNFDSLTYNMLKYNKLDRCVKLKKEDGFIYYSVEELIPILEYYSEAIKKKDIIYILNEIISVVEELKYYLIGEEFMKEGVQNIYMDKHNRLVLTISPEKGKNMNIREIFQEMILTLNFSSEENNNYILEINKYLVSGSYTLQGLKRFISKIAETNNEVKEEKNKEIRKTLAKNNNYGNIDNVVNEKKPKKKFFFFKKKEKEIQKKDIDFEFQIPNKKL